MIRNRQALSSCMDVCWENSGIARVSDGVAYLWTFHRRLARRDRGLLFALAAISTLSLHLPADLSCATGIALDGRILVFTATISLVTGFLFGLGPMFGIRHVNAGESLKRGDRIATGTQSHLRSGQVPTVSPGYFETIGIPLLRGRLFTPADTGESPWAVVINDSMAREYWGAENPIGRQLHFERATPRTVIGVVGDVLHEGLDGEPKPEMYVPVEQAPNIENQPLWCEPRSIRALRW